MKFFDYVGYSSEAALWDMYAKTISYVICKVKIAQYKESGCQIRPKLEPKETILILKGLLNFLHSFRLLDDCFICIKVHASLLGIL